MISFWGFGALLPQIFFNLAEILTRGILLTRQTKCLKNPSKFGILAQIECTQCLQFWFMVHFRDQFTASKPKILLKTKTSGKTTPLGISDNVSSRSQKNHRNFVKFRKNKHFLGANLKIGPWGHIKGLSEILR